MIGAALVAVTLAAYCYSQTARANQPVPLAIPQVPSEVPSQSPLPQPVSPANPLQYQIVTYDSQVMGGDRTYGIVLPPDYDEQSTRRYPVVFLLHGGHGDPTSWFKLGKALLVIQQLYAQGKLPHSIIVTPDGNDLRGSNPKFDPAYIDGPYGRVDTAIGDELVRVIQTRYRTLPAPAFWAIGGLSSGGWGAVNLGLHHLDHFSTLFSHSGYFSDSSGVENSPLFYVKTLPLHAVRQLRIYLDAGQEDGHYLYQTQKFHRVLNHLKIFNTFHPFPGGHGISGSEDEGWGYWHKHLADSLTYVGEQFQQARLLQTTRYAKKGNTEIPTPQVDTPTEFR